MRGFSRKALQGQETLYNGNRGGGEEVLLEEVEQDCVETQAPPRKKRAEPVNFYEQEEPENDAINIIGNEDKTSDAAMAIRALLGEGGNVLAGSEIDDDQVRALLVLLDVAEELNSPRLLKTAENFLLLSISKAGTGRKQVVGAFKGLYEPNNQPGMGQDTPSGMLRGVR
jgi:hypothetical protein